jgi:nucleoside-diphosphate-sugar epimerase
MLSVLYDILKNDATLWVIGDGGIRHQTLYAQDLATFILASLDLRTSNIVNIGSEGVPTLREMYRELAKRVNSRSKVRSVPSWLVLPMMKLAYKLNLSPLGPYQFRMLTRSFAFETDWRSLPIEWRPTKSNTDMLEIAYHYYMNSSSGEIQSLSANKSSATRGLARILTKIKI